ncbi:unnamed protein product [Closterium sp. NIES-65]|nr:unnamed protein product [Closterium sp. NIES-65]
MRRRAIPPLTVDLDSSDATSSQQQGKRGGGGDQDTPDDSSRARSSALPFRFSIGLPFGGLWESRVVKAVAPVAEGVWEWMGGSMTPVGVDEAEGEGVRYEVVGGGFYGVDGDETGSESGRDTPGSARAGLDGLGCAPMRDSAKLMSAGAKVRRESQQAVPGVVGWERSGGSVGQGQGGWEKVGGLGGTGWLGTDVEGREGGTGLGGQVRNQEREQGLQGQGLQEQALREGDAEGQVGDGGENRDANGGAGGGMAADNEQGGEGAGAVAEGMHEEAGAGGESGGGEQGGGGVAEGVHQEAAAGESEGREGDGEQRTMAACGPRQGVVVARGSLEQRMEAVCATEALTVLANTRFRALWTLRPRPRFFPKRSHSLPQSRNAGGMLGGGRQQRRRLLGEMMTGEEELRRLREARRRRMRRRRGEGVGAAEGERQGGEAGSGGAEGSMAGEVGMVRFGDLFDARMPVDVQENATEFLLRHVVAGEKLMRREISFIRCPEPSGGRVASGAELLRVAPDVRRYAQEVSRMRQATGWSPQQEGIFQEMNSQGWDSQGSASSNGTRVESGADRYGHWTGRLQLYTVRGLVLPDFADRRVACRYEEEVRVCLGKLQPSDAVLSLIRQEEEQEGGEGEEEREKRGGAGDGENGSEGREEEGSRARGVGERRDGSSIGEIVARSTAVYLEARALPCAGCPPADLLNCTMRRIAYHYMRTHAPSPSSDSSSYSSSSSSSSSDSSRLLPDFLVGAYWPSDAQTLISAFHPLRRPYLLRLTRRRQVACPSPPPLALRPERGSLRSEEQMGMRGIKYRRVGWRTQGAGRGGTQGGDREGAQGAQGGQEGQGGQQQDPLPQLPQQQQVRFVDPPRAAGQGVALDLRVVSAVGTGTQGTGGGWQGAGRQGAGAQGGGGQGRDGQGGGGQKGQYWAMKQQLKQLAQERQKALEGDSSGGALGGSGSAVQGGFAQGGGGEGEGGEGGNGQKGQYWAMKQRLKQLARERQRRRDIRGGNGSGAALGGSGSGALNRRRLLGAESATFETSQESGGGIGGSGSGVLNRRRLLGADLALTWQQLAELQEEEAARKAGASKRRDDRLCARLRLAELYWLSRAQAMFSLYRSTAADFIRAQMAFRLHHASTSSTTSTTTTNGEGGSVDDTSATTAAADASAAAGGGSGDELSVCQAPPVPPVIKSRAARHMIVDERLKAMYCYIPKVACTSWKLWFQQQRGHTTPDDIEHVHDAVTGGLDQLWHAFTESEAIRVLTRPDMFRFTFVRNPFSRVASAYLNKHVAWADPKDRLEWNKVCTAPHKRTCTHTHSLASTLSVENIRMERGQAAAESACGHREYNMTSFPPVAPLPPT